MWVCSVTNPCLKNLNDFLTVNCRTVCKYSKPSKKLCRIAKLFICWYKAFLTF